jgi:hypothetical protein
MCHVPSAINYIISDLDHFDSTIKQQDVPTGVLIAVEQNPS